MGADVTEELVMLRRTLRAERLAAVGTLAAGLAHEVRNPLNSATLQLQVLRRRIDRGQNNAEALLPVCDVVHDEIQRLDRLVTDFLAFAQKRPLDLKPTRINDLVKSVMDMIRPEAASANVEVTTELSPEARVVEAEPERLRQLLLNLTRNALEAMAPSGGGVLSVRTGPADGEGYVAIDVEDTGPGFSEDAPIFDAFYTTKPTGTGLGLAIVHRIVSDHGGTITAQSRPGQTRFTIRLAQQAAPREA
jgi:signal transduction histidine kinase